jgi:26S proteasome regulatory subunit N9
MELLEQKIRILALIELVWSRPADGRTLLFKDIAAATHLAADAVELLVMRALALGLIKVS